MLFRVVYADGLEALERGASDLTLEGDRFSVRIHIAESLEARFVFDVAGLSACTPMKHVGLEVRGADKARLAGPLELSPAEWAEVHAQWAAGKERAFELFVRSVEEKLIDPWVNWERYCRVVVPPILGGPTPTNTKILDDSTELGGAADHQQVPRRKYVMHPRVKLSDWLDRGFCAIIDGFPVVLSREPGKFAEPVSNSSITNSLVGGSASASTGVIARTWCPTLKEAALHMTHAALFASQRWDRKMDTFAGTSLTELYQRLERAHAQ